MSIFLQEPSYYWIIVSCSQIVLSAALVILLPCIENPVMYLLLMGLNNSKPIILVMVLNFPIYPSNISRAVLLIQMIGVISLLFSVPPCRHAIAQNISAYRIAVWTALGKKLPIII